jgi:hypothetical protein
MSSSNDSPISGGIILPQNQTIITNSNQKFASVLVGPPAAGKQGVAEALFNRGFVHYSSSGALIDYSRRNKIPEVIESMKAGDLVEFEHVERVSGWHYRDFITHRQFGVFDGWCRVERELQEVVSNLFKVCDVHVRFLILHAERTCAEERSRGRGRYDHDAFDRRFRIYEENVGGIIERASKLFGEDRVHKIDTTPLRKEETIEQALACFEIPN